jgi:hypothetical protein
LNAADEEIGRLTFEGEPGKFYLATNDSQKFALPAGFAPENLHQFRFIKLGGKMILQSEEFELGEMSVPEPPAKVALFTGNSSVAFEMIRLTIL